MDNTIIFNSPLLLILYAIALALALFELFTKKTGFILPIISFAIVIGTTIYALILGTELLEAAIIIFVFLLINMFGARRKNT